MPLTVKEVAEQIDWANYYAALFGPLWFWACEITVTI
jgi:hypothetical protein